MEWSGKIDLGRRYHRRSFLDGLNSTYTNFVFPNPGGPRSHKMDGELEMPHLVSLSSLTNQSPVPASTSLSAYT